MSNDLARELALREKSALRQLELEAKRKAVLRARRLNPDLGYDLLGRRCGVGRIQARRWCIEAGLGIGEAA